MAISPAAVTRALRPGRPAFLHKIERPGVIFYIRRGVRPVEAAAASSCGRRYLRMPDNLAITVIMS